MSSRIEMGSCHRHRESVGVFLALILACAGWSATPVSDRTAPLADLTEATSGNLLRGVLRPVDTRRLPARAAGVIEEFGAEEGQQVAAGTLLVQLDSRVERADVTRAEAVLAGAKSELALREFGLKLATDLWIKDKISSEKEYQDAVYAHQISARRVDQAAAEVAVAEARLRERRIEAPMAGVVFRRSRNVGEAVERLEEVILLIDASKLEFEVYGGPELLGKFKVGQEVPVRLEVGPGRGTTTMGVVSYIDPTMDPVSGTFRIKIQFTPSEKVQSGFGVTLAIPSEPNSP